ncbi:MAG: ribosome silencing factor [Myxococcales bacterium]|nr:ribosome silencing factor [Myxococcales bacterium]
MAAKKKTSRNRPEPKKKSAAKKRPARKAAPSKEKKSPARAKKPAGKTTRAPAGRKTASKPRTSKPRTSKRPSVGRPTAKKKVVVQKRRIPNPEGLELARAIAVVADDKKATDVLVLDLTHKSGAVGYDYLVLASGDSDVQLDALKNGVEDLLKARGRRPSSVEPSPDWVCLNLDDVVVHFFTPDKREMYDLEGLWSDADRISLS